jgi:hypothetical protein
MMVPFTGFLGDFFAAIGQPIPAASPLGVTVVLDDVVTAVTVTFAGGDPAGTERSFTGAPVAVTKGQYVSIELSASVATGAIDVSWGGLARRTA